MGATNSQQPAARIDVSLREQKVSLSGDNHIYAAIGAATAVALVGVGAYVYKVDKKASLAEQKHRDEVLGQFRFFMLSVALCSARLLGFVRSCLGSS